MFVFITFDDIIIKSCDTLCASRFIQSNQLKFMCLKFFVTFTFQIHQIYESYIVHPEMYEITFDCFDSVRSSNQKIIVHVCVNDVSLPCGYCRDTMSIFYEGFFSYFACLCLPTMSTL